MSNGGNGKPRNGKPLRLLDLPVKQIKAASDGSAVKPRVVKRMSIEYMKTDCCSMPMLIGVRSNGEIIIACMRCKKYIGHMIPKPYAILYQGIAGSVLKAMKKKNCKFDISMEQLEQIIQDHLDFLVEKSEEFFDGLIDRRINEAGGGDDSGEARDTDKSGGQADECETDSDLSGSGSEDDPEDDQ